MKERLTSARNSKAILSRLVFEWQMGCVLWLCSSNVSSFDRGCLFVGNPATYSMNKFTLITCSWGRTWWNETKRM